MFCNISVICRGTKFCAPTKMQNTKTRDPRPPLIQFSGIEFVHSYGSLMFRFILFKEIIYGFQCDT